jgi:hypothetical protein
MPAVQVHEHARLLAGFTRQAITELDQESLDALRDRLSSVSGLLLEEHLWRLGTQALPFALHADNSRHQAAVLALRELAVEVHLAQQAVVDEQLRDVHVAWTTAVLTNFLTQELSCLFRCIRSARTIALTRSFTPHTNRR